MPKRNRAESSESEATDRSAGSSPDASMPRERDDPDQPQTGKYVHLDSDDVPTGRQVICNLPPHALMQFATYTDYEVHYQQSHVNRCLTCHKNFPTEHYLSLHIAENHDPLLATRRDRGDKIFSCFVEDCEKICSTWQKRRMHLVDKHMFPRNYDFFIVNDGLDSRNSMLRPGNGHRRRSSAAERSSLRGSVVGRPDATHSQAEENASPTLMANSALRTRSVVHEDGVDEISHAMAALKFIPPSVRFGRRKGQQGLAKS